MGVFISCHGIVGMVLRTFGVVARTVDAIIKGANDARQMHRSYEKLSVLSDAELRDLGMVRSDIRAVVTGTYFAAPDASAVRSIGRAGRSVSAARRVEIGKAAKAA